MIKNTIYAFLFCLTAANSLVVARETAVSTSATPEFYSRIAPMVDEETAFVARLNLERADFAAFAKTTRADWDAGFERFGFDETSRERIGVEWEKEIANRTAPLKAAVDRLARAETTEIFFVGANVDGALQTFAVFPTVGKSAAAVVDLQSLLDASKRPYSYSAAKKAFVLAPNGDASAIEAALKNRKAAPNAEIEAAFAELADADATLLVAVREFPFERLLGEGGAPFVEIFASASEKNIPLKQLYSRFQRAFRRGAFQLDINTAALGATVEFSDERSATTILRLLETTAGQAGVQASIALLTSRRGIVDLSQNRVAAQLFWSVCATARGLILLNLLPEQDGARWTVAPGTKKGSGLAALGIAAVFAPFALEANADEAAFSRSFSPSPTGCSTNLKRIVLAFHNYLDCYGGALPSDCSKDADGKPLHSWRVAILPFIGETALYDQIRLDEPWDSEWNAQFHDKAPAVYQCPAADLAPGTTTYSVIVGDGSLFSNRKPSLAQITDGTSNTIAVVERKKAVCWMDPTQEFSMKDLENGFDQDADDCLSGHKDGANAAFFDGSVRFIGEQTPVDLLRAWATCAGNEVLPAE